MYKFLCTILSIILLSSSFIFSSSLTHTNVITVSSSTDRLHQHNRRTSVTQSSINPTVYDTMIAHLASKVQTLEILQQSNIAQRATFYQKMADIEAYTKALKLHDAHFCAISYHLKNLFITTNNFGEILTKAVQEIESQGKKINLLEIQVDTLAKIIEQQSNLWRTKTCDSLARIESLERQLEKLKREK